MDAFGAGLQPCSAYLWSFHLLVKSVLQSPSQRQSNTNSAPMLPPFPTLFSLPCFSQPQHHQRHKQCAPAPSTHPMLKGTAGIMENKSLIGSPFWVERSGFAAEQPAGTGQHNPTPGTTKQTPSWILPYSKQMSEGKSETGG